MCEMAEGEGSCLVRSPAAPQSGAASPRVPEVCALLSLEHCSLTQSRAQTMRRLYFDRQLFAARFPIK